MPKITPDQVMALFALKRLLEKYPTMRICQAIGNATNKLDPYFVEDAELQKALEGYRR